MKLREAKRQVKRALQERDESRDKIKELTARLDVFLGPQNVMSEEDLVQRLLEVEKVREHLRRELVEARCVKEVEAGHKSFLCPIGLQLMKDPCFAADGHSYERANIENWIQQLVLNGRIPRSPLTNDELEHDRVTPNHNLRGMIKQALQEAHARASQSGSEGGQTLEGARVLDADPDQAVPLINGGRKRKQREELQDDRHEESRDATVTASGREGRGSSQRRWTRSSAVEFERGLGEDMLASHPFLSARELRRLEVEEQRLREEQRQLREEEEVLQVQTELNDDRWAREASLPL